MTAARRPPLSRDRILAVARDVADADGLAALSMRRLGARLGVEAMSLYNHFPNKEALLDALVDRVVGEIPLPRSGNPWRPAMRARAQAARAMFGRHSWALGLMESRGTPGAASLRSYDAVLGCLLGAGFPLPLAARAFATLDAYVYGFALQEAKLPFRSPEETREVVGSVFEGLVPEDFPHLARLAADHVLRPDDALADEFAGGLEIVLDGIERALERLTS